MSSLLGARYGMPLAISTNRGGFMRSAIGRSVSRRSAREYVRSPVNTLVVSPDNESRREINQHIHRAMQDTGEVKGEEHRVHVLYARQDITGATGNTRKTTRVAT